MWLKCRYAGKGKGNANTDGMLFLFYCLPQCVSGVFIVTQWMKVIQPCVIRWSASFVLVQRDKMNYSASPGVSEEPEREVCVLGSSGLAGWIVS